MPISGIVIRFLPDLGEAPDLSHLSSVAHVELGTRSSSATSAVIDAPDYPAHDASLSALRDVSGVCAVDIVFHDFSDVAVFGALPEKRRTSR
jgi:nitrate reductase NapAB chaperone NapD